MTAAGLPLTDSALNTIKGFTFLITLSVQPGGALPPPPTPLQTPGILQIPEVSAAGYSVITPGSAAPTPTTTTAATTTTTAPAPSVALEVGGWSPTQGQPPNTASIVAACADTGGYVRVPVQILQRYLELEWRQWQNRFFGGGGGYIFDI